MTSEFKKIKDNNDTRYILETVTAGATGAGVIATAPGKKREDSILAQEKKETPKPRNFVAKNAKMGGAGQHKDKKKAAKQGDVKHKNKEMAEGEKTMSRAAKGNEKYGKDGMKALAKAGREGASEKKLDAIRDKHDNYNEGLEDPKDNPCWTGYKPVGTKKKAGKTVPNCVPKESLAEGIGGLGYDAQALITKLRRDVEEKRLQATPDAVLAAAGELAGDMKFAPQLLVQQVLGKGMAEGFNGEYDDEAGMAHNNLLTSARAVMGLLKTIDDKDNLPEWVQEKIAKAEMMLVGVWDYLQSQKEMGVDPQVEGFGKMRGSSSAYDRDYASSVSGMGRGPDHRGLGQELAHETNNYAVAIDGRTWKVFADQRQAENIARSLKAKGKNATVHPTGENPSESVAEVAPPGWEKTVKAMKKHDNIDNPFALAWSMKNKGYKSHKKESADPYFESLRAKVEELAKK
jgi:hypothetical protein